MTYAVTWSVAAVLELGRIAATHAVPAAVDGEAVWMDSILRRYPYAMGESRVDSERLWYADILGIWYQIDDGAMTVTVLSVGPARRH